MDDATAVILADESRRQLARAKVAQAKGVLKQANAAAQAVQPVVNAVGALSNALWAAGDGAQKALAAAMSDLATIESGPGSLPCCTTDQTLQAERDVGLGAMIDFVKANQSCSEGDAIGQWKVAVLAGKPPDRQWLLVDPAALRQEYSANLIASHRGIADSSWQAFRDFMVKTEKATLLAL